MEVATEATQAYPMEVDDKKMLGKFDDDFELSDREDQRAAHVARTWKNNIFIAWQETCRQYLSSFYVVPQGTQFSPKTS